MYNPTGQTILTNKVGFEIVKGTFFWDYSSNSYYGLRITEYTEYQFPKESICQIGPKRTGLPSVQSIPFPE